MNDTTAAAAAAAQNNINGGIINGSISHGGDGVAENIVNPEAVNAMSIEPRRENS